MKVKEFNQMMAYHKTQTKKFMFEKIGGVIEGEDLGSRI